jgi:hypothetical protein
VSKKKQVKIFFAVITPGKIMDFFYSVRYKAVQILSSESRNFFSAASPEILIFFLFQELVTGMSEKHNIF